MLQQLVVFAALTLGGMQVSAETLPWTGDPVDWHGCARYNFEVADRPAYVVVPAAPAAGNPWVWRARFPQYHSEVDQLLVAKGFHLAYLNTDGLLGCDTALDAWDRFYEELTERRGLAKKVVLEAVSRGGLFAYRWAARHPHRVACIYADTPVLDFKSWPLGNGKGIGDARTWETLLEHYGFTQEEALAYTGNPLDNLEPLARAGVPVYHIVSLTDQVVPPEENTFVLRDRYKRLGGEVHVETVKEGTPQSKGHHFPLPSPQRAFDFIVKNTFAWLPNGHDYHIVRGGLPNCRIKFAREKRGKVVFLGGSITNMDGWRQRVGDALQERFPETEFEFVNAGIPSTGSVPGAFRLIRDAFTGGAPDLLFEEAAVNDTTNRPGNVKQWRRGMEGIVRHALTLNPNLDLVLMHFVDPEKMTAYRAGETPPVTVAHEEVADHYAVPSLNLAREVTDRIDAGQFTWERDFRGLHPAPYGHRLYAASIERLFDACWAEPLAADAHVEPHELPAEPLDRGSYFDGQLIDLGSAQLGPGWKLDPSWRPTRPEEKAGTRPGFVEVPMLVSNTPGSTLKLSFTGRGVGLWIIAGPDTGMAEWSVDGAPFKSRDAYTQWSARLHIPWTLVLEDELDEGRHELTLRVAEGRNARSKGTALRIVSFVVNGQ